MKSNSYNLFKQRLDKMPIKVKQAIVESVKNSKNTKVVLKEFFIQNDKRLLKEAKWEKMAKDFDKQKDPKQVEAYETAERALILSLSNAGYKDKKAQIFVDYIMNGNYKKFLSSLRTHRKLANQYQTGAESKNTIFVKGEGRPGAENRAPGGVSPRLTGTGLSSNDDFDNDRDGFNNDDKKFFDDGISKKEGRGIKNKLSGVMKKVKNKLTPNWKKELNEAIKNKDYNKLRLLKEQLRKEIQKALIEATVK